MPGSSKIKKPVTERLTDPRPSAVSSKNDTAIQPPANGGLAESATDLLAGDHLMAALLENVPDRIYLKDKDSRFLKISRAMARRFGLENPDMVIGKMDSDFMSPERAKEFFKDEQRIIQTGVPLINKIEKQVLPDGTEAWTSTTKVPIRDHNGTIIGIVGINRDVTAQKQAEENLRRAHNELEQRVAERTKELSKERHLLRTLVDKLPDYIFVKDLQSRFIVINTACAHQLGAKGAGDVIGKTDADFAPAELAAQYRKDECALMKSGETMHKEEPFVHQETGEKRWSLTTKIPLRDEAGAVVGLIGIARDITAIKEAERKVEVMHRELREASRLAGMAEVATGVLHNVGNVLNSANVAANLIATRLRNSKSTGVTRLSQLLLEHRGDLARFLTEDERGSSVPAYLQQLAEHLEQERGEIDQEVQRLTMNIEHIKEIVAAQQSYAQVFGVAELVELPVLLEDALKINGAAYERHGIQLVREFETIPTISVDRHKVMQIVVNLLSNAKYACDAANHKGKRVAVRLRSNGNQRVKIEVTDNGIGVPKENLKRIFSQGFTTRKGGHGFGLHSGVLAAQELGGSLEVHSDGVGRGATFVLELPMVPPDAKKQ